MCSGLLPARCCHATCCLQSPAQGGASLGAGMCQLPWHVQWWGKGSLSKLQPGSTHHQIPSPPSALAQALICPRAQLYFPLIALIPASDFQGTELKLCSVWPWKAKNSIEPLGSLFFIWSGLESKAASLVLENSNRFPLHGVYLKRNKDN